MSGRQRRGGCRMHSMPWPRPAPWDAAVLASKRAFSAPARLSITSLPLSRKRQPLSLRTCAWPVVRRTNKPPLGMPRKIGQGCKWRSFSTNTYKLHFLESPSGIKVSDGSRRRRRDGGATGQAGGQHFHARSQALPARSQAQPAPTAPGSACRPTLLACRRAPDGAQHESRRRGPA